jgi:SWI/SNF-related matrix-associated actin-dependent regulator of chromatin subfamily B member 1
MGQAPHSPSLPMSSSMVGVNVNGITGGAVGMMSGMMSSGGMGVSAELPSHLLPHQELLQPQTQTLIHQGSVAPKQGTVPPLDNISLGVSQPVGTSIGGAVGTLPNLTISAPPLSAHGSMITPATPTSTSASSTASAIAPVSTTTTTSIPVTSPSSAHQQQQPPAAEAVPQLPPLPANVSLNPAVTRVTVVPLVDSISSIPPLSEDEIVNIKKWIEVDKEYETVFRGMKERMTEEVKEALYGWGKRGWWEKGGGAGVGTVQMEGHPWGSKWRRAREPFDVRYPRARKDRDGRSRRGTKREGLRL